MKYSDDPELFERHVEMWKSTELDPWILERVANWDISTENSVIELLDYVQSLWSMPELTEERDGWYIFNTLGDAQNERLIKALYSNNKFWLFYWYSSVTSGTYIFKTVKGFFTDSPFYKYINKEE